MRFVSIPSKVCLSPAPFHKINSAIKVAIPGYALQALPERRIDSGSALNTLWQAYAGQDRADIREHRVDLETLSAIFPLLVASRLVSADYFWWRYLQLFVLYRISSTSSTIKISLYKYRYTTKIVLQQFNQRKFILNKKNMYIRNGRHTYHKNMIKDEANLCTCSQRRIVI